MRPRALHALGRGGQRTHCNVLRVHQPAVADEGRDAAHVGARTLPVDVGEAGRLGQRLAFSALQDRDSQRMLRVLLERSGGGQHVLARPSRRGHDFDDLRTAQRQRAGLVEDHDVELRRRLERGRILEQDPVLRAKARPHHHGHRHRQPQRIGARDDEHGDRQRQRE